MIRFRSIATLAALLASAALTLSGCGAYQLQGRVVHGNSAEVLVVERNDPRLQEAAGVAGADVRLTIDPQSLGRTMLPTQMTRPDGSFAITVDEFGAGALEYDAMLLVRREGHEHAEGLFKLPRSSQRVLVVLPRGVDRYSEPDDPLEDLERFAD